MSHPLPATRTSATGSATRDGKRQRSAGIFLTMRRAEAARRAIEHHGRELLPRPTEPDPAKTRTLFGEYVTSRWWPAWKDQHPASEYGTRKKVEKRILPTFGDIPLAELDPSTIGAWKAAMVAEGLTARTENLHLSRLGTILNAAVDDDYLARSPLLRKSGAGRTAATRNQPVPQPRSLAAARAARPARRRDRPPLPGAGPDATLTGMRWGELIALRWDDPASTSPWTTARSGGRDACGSPARSATPGGPAAG